MQQHWAGSSISILLNMSDPQLLQGTSVSALTTYSGIVDLLVDNGGGEETTLLPLTSIFHCPFSKECSNSKNGKMGWLCTWCGKKFSPRHQSRGQFSMCWKSSWVILPFSLFLFPRSMRIDTVHCMSAAQSKYNQRSAHTPILMTLWQSNKQSPLQIYLESVA